MSRKEGCKARLEATTTSGILYLFGQGKVELLNFEKWCQWSPCSNCSHSTYFIRLSEICQWSLKCYCFCLCCFFSLQTGRNRPPVWPSGFDSESNTFLLLNFDLVDLFKTSFQVRVVRTKPITCSQTQTWASNEPMRRGSFVTCHWRQARENARERHVITSCFLSYWLSKCCNVFLNQSQRIVNQLKPK